MLKSDKGKTKFGSWSFESIPLPVKRKRRFNYSDHCVSGCIPFDDLSGYTTFFSEEFVQSSDFEKLICVVCAGFVLSTVTIGLFASVNFNLWAAEKWCFLVDGLHGKNLLGRERFVPWTEIQDACICDLYGIRGKSFRAVRFTTDKKADDKLRIKSRKKRFWKNWPLWLDLDYNYHHRKKIVIIEYLPELEIEYKKYFYLW